MTDSAVTHFTTSELQATSQDGKYKAFVVDQTLEVYSADDNVLQFRSTARPAGITSLVWSPDSKTITYETPAADGKSKLRYRWISLVRLSSCRLTNIICTIRTHDVMFAYNV